MYCQLAIIARQCLLHITLSAASFLHSNTFDCCTIIILSLLVITSYNYNYIVLVSLLGKWTQLSSLRLGLCNGMAKQPFSRSHKGRLGQEKVCMLFFIRSFFCLLTVLVRCFHYLPSLLLWWPWKGHLPVPCSQWPELGSSVFPPACHGYDWPTFLCSMAQSSIQSSTTHQNPNPSHVNR